MPSRWHDYGIDGRLGFHCLYNTGTVVMPYLVVVVVVVVVSRTTLFHRAVASRLLGILGSTGALDLPLAGTRNAVK